MHAQSPMRRSMQSRNRALPLKPFFKPLLQPSRHHIPFATPRPSTPASHSPHPTSHIPLPAQKLAPRADGLHHAAPVAAVFPAPPHARAVPHAGSERAVGDRAAERGAGARDEGGVRHEARRQGARVQMLAVGQVPAVRRQPQQVQQGHRQPRRPARRQRRQGVDPTPRLLGAVAVLWMADSALWACGGVRRCRVFGGTLCLCLCVCLAVHGVY